MQTSPYYKNSVRTSLRLGYLSRFSGACPALVPSSSKMRGVSRAPASTRSKSLEPRTEKGQVPTPPSPPQPPTPSPAIAWKGLLSAHNLAGFPKKTYGSPPANRSQTWSTTGTVTFPSKREFSADNFTRDKLTQKELTQRLTLMTTFYDATLQSSNRGEKVADVLQKKAPLSPEHFDGPQKSRHMLVRAASQGERDGGSLEEITLLLRAKIPLFGFVSGFCGNLAPSHAGSPPAPPNSRYEMRAQGGINLGGWARRRLLKS